MKRAATAALAVAAFVAGGSPTWASASAGKKKPPKLGALLLRVGQMPTGWSVDNSSSGSGVGCLASTMEPKGVKQTASATVYFDENGNVPEVSERLATYSGSASKAFAAIVSKLDHCKRISGSSGGTNITGTLGQMSFPHYGDQSAAFAARFTAQGTTLGEDILIVKKGAILMGISEADLGSPDLGQFKGFIKKALTRLP